VTRKPLSLAALALAGTVVLAACGGTAASVAPASVAPSAAPVVTAAPTVAPTVAPTPTPSPTLPPTATPGGSDEPSIGAASLDPALGGFAFSPTDILDYYKSTGFECEDAYASTQVTGYTVQRCLVERENGLIELVALVVKDDTGAIGNAFAAELRRPGETMPTAEESGDHLGGFTTAMLGANPEGIAAAKWLGERFGTESQQTVRDILMGTYTTNDETGVGIYVEFANQEFLGAAKP
jgi:hypothetical protein